jgi:putative ABC transport system ATP-binding protein
MIEITNLSHRFDKRPVLDVPSWSVSKGQAALVLGQSGSGKSTLLHCLTGLLTPTSGTIEVAGTRLSSLSPALMDRFRGRTFGIVFQSIRLISSLTVMQNLALARSLAGKSADLALAQTLLDQLGIAKLANAKPRTLSIGEAQRAAIARAAVSEPAVLVADEPTSALDDANAAAVAQLLKKTAQSIGATIIVATHDHRLVSLFDQRLDLGGPRP